MATPTPYWGRNDDTLKSRGTDKASLIILGELDKVASDPTHTRLDVTAPVEAQMALGRNRRSVACMGSGSYNHTMQKPRKSKLPKQLYTDLSNILKTASADETTALPDMWELRRRLIMEFQLHDHAPIVTWTALITSLHNDGLNNPAQLTDLTLEKVKGRPNLGAIPDMPQILWQAANRQLAALGPNKPFP